MRLDTAKRATVKRLSLCTERLIQISIDEKRLWSRLADLGCVASTLTPVASGESAQIVRVKEALFRCRRARNRVLAELTGMGAEVCDWETMEVLLPGGPEPGSRRSWMPGEPIIAWWRDTKNRDTPRRLLPGLDSRDIGPNQH
jgi:hypothetical protein